MASKSTRAKAIGAELDGVTIEIMATLDALATLRQQLDKEMQDGFFNMAKARYTMGNKLVSSVQHDGREMTAITRVSELENEVLDLVTLPTSIEVEIENSADAHDDGSLEDHESYDFDSPRPLLRQRIAEAYELLSQEDHKCNRVDTDQKQYKTVSRDPLRMFGLLVPQSLKASKACFQRSILVVIKICENQKVLARLQKAYELKLQEKNTLGLTNAPEW